MLSWFVFSVRRQLFVFIRDEHMVGLFWETLQSLECTYSDKHTHVHASLRRRVVDADFPSIKWASGLKDECEQQESDWMNAICITANMQYMHLYIY